ncbi:E3 ubiquitin-protein ligase [Haematococcus lacustris]|uniref:E3 ubiquitin-protein ligase n=1 Tax=Haematococcus lacustris TaxID=44745 RepID=A0A699Z886_HAELA|nr:E3 ubiquitin-protein ligase [Haematococcus lacustris]
MILGFFWLLATAVAPHVTFMVALCKRLDGDTLVTLPVMLLALGLREKERVRSRLLATGAVWTAHENIARRLQGQRDREGEQHRVDTMTDDEVEQLVEQLMSARTVSLAPARLLRVGPTLYKQLAGAGSIVVPEEGVDDGLCVICYDKPSSCVFLDCGHGGFCKACAYRIFVRPPNECPTCRQHIEQLDP